MRKREFSTANKSTLKHMGFVLVIPLLYLLEISADVVFYIPFVKVYQLVTTMPEDPYLILFVLFLGIMVLVSAAMSGLSCFRQEHRDGAFEYLLSFPVSRKQILLNKLMPRLYILLAWGFVYEILALIFIIPLREIQGPLFFLMDPLFFPVCLIFMFASGFFLSLFEQKNWIAVISLMTLMAIVVFSLTCRLFINLIFPSIDKYLRHGLSFTLATLIIIGLLSIPFIRVYKRFDAKSMAIHSKRFVLRTLPLMTILILIGLIYLIF